MTQRAEPAHRGDRAGRPARGASILVHEPATAEVARHWVPECAERTTCVRADVPRRALQSHRSTPAPIKARYQVGPIDPTILYVGDLSERYGPDLLHQGHAGDPQEPPAGPPRHRRRRRRCTGRCASTPATCCWSTRSGCPATSRARPLDELIQAADVIAVPSREADAVVADPGRLGRAAGRWWPRTTRPPACWSTSRTACCSTRARTAASGASSASCSTPNSAARLGAHGASKLDERFGWNTVAAQVEELMGVAQAWQRFSHACDSLDVCVAKR